MILNEKFVGNVLNKSELICIQLNISKYCYLTLIILLNMNHLFAHS